MNNALAGDPDSGPAISTAGMTLSGRGEAGGRTGIVLRSVALFAILYQFRLIAGSLSDTTVYVAAILGAFATAVFLNRRIVSSGNGFVKKMGPLAALVTIALVPWAIRAFIAMPRLLFPGRTDSVAITLDALLLNFDRNNFVSLLPFYWAAVTTWFALRSRLFLRGVVVADIVLLIAIFTFAPIADVGIYRWPVVVIAVVAGIVFLQALALLFSMPKGTKLQKKEKITAIIVLLILVIAGGFIFLGPAQQRAAHRGGGLLEPRGLFSFDFSQVLSLNPEISMSDDLLLIVRTDPPVPNPPRVNPHVLNLPRTNPPRQAVLIRRAVMSGFDRRQGFFRIEELDERTHPQRVPNRQTELPPPGFPSSRQVSQEFFLVNFEASAFIGMNQPVKITPFETWDESSFRAAYAVESTVMDFGLADFIRRGGGRTWPGLSDFGLTEREFAMYTYYGNDVRLRALALEITRDYEFFPEKILAVYSYLKFGEFRYSFRPGIAPDGDQLAWFLFYAKRGYCTYFAFAMALMLRSLGIPARVAAGFFIDPGSSAFNYYAIRADMAHAWVEVLFPGYGWVEFDPTTERLAEDEEFNFSMGVDRDLFERLMREIWENRDQLRARVGPDADDGITDVRSFIQAGVVLLRRIALPLILVSLTVVFVLIRCGYLFLSGLHGRKRKKATNLWKHTRRRLRLAGMGCPSTLAESEWALRSDSVVKGTYDMYLGFAAARFAPEYDDGDYASMVKAYGGFDAAYKKSVSLWRRFLAWALPPLALVLPVKPSAGKTGLAVLLLVTFAAVHDGGARNADVALPLGADDLFSAAVSAEHAENWDRAVSLYREGTSRFPDDIRFPWALGNLYFGRSLYTLAWDELRRAEAIDPHNTHILQRLASTAGFLNRDHAAVDFLERLLEIDPYNRIAIGDLGWMYYKVHRLADGERLLLGAIERFGLAEDFAMTLGTINAAMFRYEEGRYWYRIATAARSRHFRAIAHYNLSILESRFFQYERAMEQANASLEAQRRASGFLSRGDLQVRQLELEGAMTDFVYARETDPSPLSKVNLARVHLLAGRLVEARLYALSSLRVSDHAWMAHFGINMDRYLRDVHHLLYNIYSGLARAERFVPNRTLFQAIASGFRRGSYWFHATVHRKLFQKYSLATGDAFDRIIGGGGFADAGSWEPGGENQGAPPIDRYLQFFNAFRTYPRRAVAYLRKARGFETSIIPASVPSYDLEEGMLTGNLAMVAAARDGFDPVWQRDMIAVAYRELALNSRTRQARQYFAEELFALNRGALLQAGIALPVEIDVSFDTGGNSRRSERTLRGALAKAGFARSASSPGGGEARFRLSVAVSAAGTGGYIAFAELTDTETREVPFRRTVPLPSLSGADIYDFVAALSIAVFRAY